MKLKISLVSLTLVAAPALFAQSDAPASAAQNAAPAQTAPAAPAQTVTVTTIAAPTAAAEIVKQPTTIVEATPLTTSKAEELRKSREQAEVETEQKIVEKLEQARIQDEKRRQEKVLGSFAAASEEKPVEKKSEPAPAPAPQQPSVVVIQPPATPVVQAQSGTSKEDVHGIVKEELSRIEKTADQKSYFFSAGVGTLNYNNSSDVRGFGAVALSFGEVMPTGFSISGDFGYNNLNQDADVFGNYRAVDQYTAGATGRFFLLTGKFRPAIGAAIDYVRRQYSGIQGAYGNATYNNLGKMSSNALDAGVVAGVDVGVSENMALAFEYRYMMNMTYKYDNQNVLNSAAYSYSGMPSPLEGRNYQSMMFVLRYTY